MNKRGSIQVKRIHPLAWAWETLQENPRCEVRSFFGGRAVYFAGKLCLFFAAKEEPWNGVCICTDHERQESLVNDFSGLKPHEVLPKWLYYSQEQDDFEDVVTRLVDLVRNDDKRIGVEPGRAKKAKRIKR